MPTCPKCHRDSLEFNEARKSAWCLYADCVFIEKVTSYKDYIAEFDEAGALTVEEIIQEIDLRHEERWWENACRILLRALRRAEQEVVTCRIELSNLRRAGQECS